MDHEVKICDRSGQAIEADGISPNHNEMDTTFPKLFQQPPVPSA